MNIILKLISPVIVACSIQCYGQTLWLPTDPLNQPRLQTTGVLLSEGGVLLAGSLLCNPQCHSLPSAEIFDPATSTWTPTSPMLSPRFNHAVAGLKNGNVLVVGGYQSPGMLTGGCELFDVATGTWRVTGSLSTPRQFHTSVVLADGRVLVAGGLGMNGQGGFEKLSSAEVYDPATGTWSAAGNMATQRFENSLTTLADGRVLAVGGSATSTGPALATAEIYNPAINGWTLANPPPLGLQNHSATLLPNGQVLVAGGFQGSSSVPARLAEVYDPASDTWTRVASMRVPRAGHTATLLANGSIAVIGGFANWVTTEIYDPNAGTWSPSLELNEGRAYHSTTLLNDGRILAAGGVDIDNNFLTSAELLGPRFQFSATRSPRRP